MNNLEKTTSKKDNVLSNMLWRFAERCGAQIVSFIVSVVLARILAPEAYGTIALITVITTILQVFVDSGLGNALIQKKDADDIDFSSVFYINMILCVVLYCVVYCFAPLIANFYEDSTLTPLIRILSITVIVSGLKNVQQAYVSKMMQFKKFFFSALGGTLFAAVVGISMALAGYGVWALVAQQVANVTVNTIILWFTVKWRPKLVFSWSRVKSLLSYGWKLLVSALIDKGYNSLRQLVIGKKYSTGDLAFYDRGQQLPNLIVANINSSLDSVLLPVMSSVQDNNMLVKNMTRKSIKISTYIMAPMMIGLAVTAPSVVELVFTDKWLPCVPFLRIFCIDYMFYAIHTANLNAIKAVGRSDLFLKMEIFKKVAGITIILIAMQFGVMAIAYSVLLFCLVGQVINSWPNKRLLSYGYLEQIKDILPSILLALGMGIVVLPIEYLRLPVILTLILQVVIGAACYIAGSIIFKNDSFRYLLAVVKPLICKVIKR